MGMIAGLLSAIFGDGRNLIRETAEVFRENAEAGAVRDLDRQSAALRQFAAEFQPRRGLFDALIDGLNRLPRPLLALGTIGLMVSAMVDPVWFGERMMGLALVPEALWWLMGAVVSFYFGARHQLKGQQFQREIAETLARSPAAEPAPGLEARSEAHSEAHSEAEPNPALDEWRFSR
ncbi:holin family protein [Pseudooceanicola nanhaiensis]|uniref:holin family protein n=1 Tax=Pseudooceanicola nanhaiensis TaxID=375761 RepID=UPI0035143BBB